MLVDSRSFVRRPAIAANPLLYAALSKGCFVGHG